MPTDENPLPALISTFKRFYAVLDATTIPIDSGRRVDGGAHAVALCEATNALYLGMARSLFLLSEKHGRRLADYPPGLSLRGAESPDGPWHEIPAERVRITCVPTRADSLLMAALDSASRVVRCQPQQNRRWHAGDVVTLDDLSRLESVAKLLELRAEDDTPGNEPQTIVPAENEIQKEPRPKRPVDRAFRAYWIRELMGISNQEDIARQMIKMGAKATQGQVSRWLDDVDAWHAAGGFIPNLADLNKPQTMDPAKLELGARQDGRTPRQRSRGDSDADSQDD